MSKGQKTVGELESTHPPPGPYRVKAAKTCFFQRYVEYLGYGVTDEGVHLTKKAVGLIRSWPVPTSGAELASVLGFLGYYRESVVEFAKLMSEMNALKTKKVWVPVDWTSGMQAQSTP